MNHHRLIVSNQMEEFIRLSIVYKGLNSRNYAFQVQHSFDDPEGKIEMPPTMKVDHWKRPQDYITEKVRIN